MTIIEFYEKINGDYEDVLGRLANDTRIDKYIRKFAENTDYDNYHQFLSEGKCEEIFRSIHNIKGMCLNMSFTELSESSSVLCDAYRNGPPAGDVSAMEERFENDYKNLITAIKEYIA